jgi:DNA-binding PadR family transcriptional regulator
MKWEKEPDFNKKIIHAFLDVAIICRLDKKAMGAYAINRIFIKEFGIIIGPGTIYLALYYLERNGFIECLQDKPGRIFTLTKKGRDTIETFPDVAKQTSLLIKILLHV